jgi:hypothetical protein
VNKGSRDDAKCAEECWETFSGKLFGMATQVTREVRLKLLEMFTGKGTGLPGTMWPEMMQQREGVVWEACAGDGYLVAKRREGKDVWPSREKDPWPRVL